MNRREHWNHVYGSTGERGVSWFETLPVMSIRMTQSFQDSRFTRIH